MRTFSIVSLLSEKLVGKQLKHISAFERIEQDSHIWVKKPTATEKQFLGGNPRFRVTKCRPVHLGFRTQFDYSEIIEIKFEKGYYDDPDTINIILANGKEVEMNPDTDIIEVDKDVFYINW